MVSWARVLEAMKLPILAALAMCLVRCEPFVDYYEYWRPRKYRMPRKKYRTSSIEDYEPTPEYFDYDLLRDAFPGSRKTSQRPRTSSIDDYEPTHECSGSRTTSPSTPGGESETASSTSGDTASSSSKCFATACFTTGIIVGISSVGAIRKAIKWRKPSFKRGTSVAQKGRDAVASW